MKNRTVKSIKLWAGLLAAIIIYYIIHEGVHLVIALIYGVFEKVRFSIFGIRIVIADNSLNGMRHALLAD